MYNIEYSNGFIAYIYSSQFQKIIVVHTYSMKYGYGDGLLDVIKILL